MEFNEFNEILPVFNANPQSDDQNEQTTECSFKLKILILNKKLDKLKSIIDFPRYYVAGYFEDLRKEVDLVGTRLTMADDIIIFPTQRKLKENWALIINKLNLFEQECLKKLPNNKLSPELFIDFSQTIKQIELKLNNIFRSNVQTEAFLSEIDDQIYDEMFRLKRLLFLNKSFLFLEESQSLIEDLFVNMNMTFTLGKLLCINEYFGKRGLSRITSKFKTTESEQKKITNETVKSEILIQLLSNKFKTKNTVDEVNIDFNDLNRFDCNSKNLEVIDSTSFKNMISLNEIRLYNNNFKTLDANLFKNLNNLTNIYMSNNHLIRLDENLFRNLGNLTQIDLKYNRLEVLSSNIFKGLKNLTHIHLTGNRLKHLDRDLFDGLTKLSGVYLSSNKFETLDSFIFRGLVNLTEIYLRENRLKFLDKNIFNGLNRLTYLRLNNNRLETLDSELFHGLNNLTGIWLDNNKIKELDSNLFHGLPKLELITLSNNKLINPQPFLGLNKAANVYYT